MNFYLELRINTTNSMNKECFVKIRYTLLILECIMPCM